MQKKTEVRKFSIKKNFITRDIGQLIKSADIAILEKFLLGPTLLEKFRNVPGNFWATNVPNFYQ